MFFAYLLLVVLPIAAVVYIVWSYRRKIAQRDAMSTGRMHELLGVAAAAPREPEEEAPLATVAPATMTPRANTAPASSAPASPPSSASASVEATSTAGVATSAVTPLTATSTARSAAAAPAPPPAPAAPAKPANAPVGRERLLNPSQTLLYYLLRTALPDHVVFAQMSAASVLDASPTLAAYAREEQSRIYARHIVDFVVADKSTRPVAAVKLTGTGDDQRAALGAMRDWFAGSGVRYVEIDAVALPRKEAVRAIVLGESEAAENAESSTAAPQ